MSQHEDVISPRWTVILFAALGILSLLGLQRGLWTPDEPREAEISREMFLLPSVIPTLNGASFIEKPPLYYWTVAGAFELFGGPSVAVARAVSGIAGFLTLFVVYAWGRRACSALVGLTACVMLASSIQFLLSTHWVLLDPMLMLLTTLAAWAGWQVLEDEGGQGAVAAFYGSLILALWAKGLIGVVLVAAGLVTYALTRRNRPWRRMQLAVGVVVLFAGVAGLAAALYAEGGTAALHEWFWVNHVERFLNPGRTGHRQPPLYYLWTLPFAVLPWIIPAVAVLRPTSWRAAGSSERLRTYCGSMVLGMVLVLSASLTKRGTYLLPMLPMLFLLLAAEVARWYDKRADDASLGAGWWLQLGICSVFALAGPVAALIYLRRVDYAALTVLVAGGLLIALVIGLSMRGQRRSALVGLLGLSLATAASLLVLVPRALDGEKDMAPFVAWVDAELPRGAPVYAVGVDESLEGVVRFYSGRSVIAVDPALLLKPAAAIDTLPVRVLVQDKEHHLDLTPLYDRVGSRRFGPGRAMTLWQRRDRAAPFE